MSCTMQSMEALQCLESSVSLLPPPSPADYVDTMCWAEKQDRWPGHGFFWKEGEGAMNKDLGFSDWDALEPGFRRLRRASVLLADRDLLRSMHPEQLQGLSDEQVDQALLESAAYGSEPHTLLLPFVFLLC